MRLTECIFPLKKDKHNLDTCIKKWRNTICVIYAS